MADIVKSGASLLNSIKNSSASFVGHWEDVKDYNTLILTLQSPMDGSGSLKWANTTRRQFPSDEDVVAEETFFYQGTSAKTLQWDHRGRWFKLQYTDTSTGPSTYSDYSMNIETLYKGVATEPKISDDAQNVVNLHRGDAYSSYQMIYTDVSGVPLATTSDAVASGEALFVNLQDASSNYDLAHTVTAGTQPESLFTAIRDNNNDSFTSSNNTLNVHTSNIEGYSQAATIEVSGAYTSGRALYLTGADNTGTLISSIKEHPDTSGSNALYVHLTLSGGEAVNSTNPLPCIETDKIAQTIYFDISSGITANEFKTVSDLSSGNVNLFNLFTYNDGPVTVWTKLYDMSTGYVTGSGGYTYSDYNNRVLLNVATPAGQCRDFKFPRGMLFNEGLHFRSSTEHSYDSSADPGQDVLFINGAYFKPTAAYTNNEVIDYDARGLDDEFGEVGVADVPTFSGLSFPFAATMAAEPEAEPEPEVRSLLTGLEGLEEPEPLMTDKTIAFNAEGDNRISGSVTFSYNAEDELLSLSTTVNESAHPLKEISFCYDEMGNQVQYDMEITELQLGVALTTENINITSEQLESSKVLIVLENDMEVSIAYNGV